MCELKKKMGRRRRRSPSSSCREKDSSISTSQTLPSSPTHSFSSSSSSSDFEFRISASDLICCPADDLFYKGQLLPLHLSPRLSMLQTLLLASLTTSSNSSPRDSTTSTTSTSSSLYSECDSSRPSSATDEDHHHHDQFNKPKHSSLCSRLISSLFRKGISNSTTTKMMSRVDNQAHQSTGSSISVMKRVLTRCLKKVKPFCDKLSQRPVLETKNNKEYYFFFKGRSSSRCVSSCPSSIRSSPSHSRNTSTTVVSTESWSVNKYGSSSSSGSLMVMSSSSNSSMEELQSAIQGAIAHCKNSYIGVSASMSKEI